MPDKKVFKKALKSSIKDFEKNIGDIVQIKFHKENMKHLYDTPKKAEKLNSLFGIVYINKKNKIIILGEGVNRKEYLIQ